MVEPVTDGPENPPPPTARRRIRWWPAGLVLLAVIGCEIWIWGFYGRQRQDRNLATLIVLVFALPLLWLWCLLLSRMKWRVRLALVGLTAGPLALVSILFRIQGVTGDLIPVLRFRWGKATWTAVDSRGGAPVVAQSAAPNGTANEYPQFEGPNRNGVLDRPRLARDWKARPPQLLWRQPVGTGWSGFAVAGGRAITMEQRGEEETVACYDVLSGTPVWASSTAAHFQSTLAGEGPRATPTIAGGKVYALGATGTLNCMNLADGKVTWSKDIVADTEAKMEGWGMTSSPLLVGDLVVVSVGGNKDRSLVAYRASSGDFVWGGGSDRADYSSPMVATFAGVRQILIFNSGGVSAHDPVSGTNLWKYHWPGGHPHVSMPVVLPGDRLLISSGYGTGSEVVSVQKDSQGRFGATRVWKSNRLKAKFTNLVCRNGFIYGLDDGIMACLDAATGEQKWKEGRYGHGQEILVGELLLVGAESGEMILLDPDPRESRELTRFSALSGKTWNPPALAGDLLVVRNDKEAACYRLPVAQP